MNFETELAFDDQQIESTINDICEDYGFASALMTVFAGEDGIAPTLYLSHYTKNPDNIRDFVAELVGAIQNEALNWGVNLVEVEPSMKEATIYFNPAKDASSHFKVKNLDNLNYSVKSLRERELERKGAA